MNSYLIFALTILGIGTGSVLFTVLAGFDYVWLTGLIGSLLVVLYFGISQNSNTDFSLDKPTSMIGIGIMLILLSFTVIVLDDVVISKNLTSLEGFIDGNNSKLVH